MILSIVILGIGFIVIIVASIYENEITNYCKNIIVLKQASQYISAIFLTIVNYIVPK